MTQAERSNRKSLEGLVVSDKMDKTRVIAVEWSKRDQKYGKIIHRTTKVLAHDEENKSHKGNRVRLMSTRPLSKTKSWRISHILK